MPSILSFLGFRSMFMVFSLNENCDHKGLCHNMLIHLIENNNQIRVYLVFKTCLSF